MKTGGDHADLIKRLRGIYTIPVNDGAGLLNGKDTFTRKFEGLPPINEEAAKAIEQLTEERNELAMRLQGISRQGLLDSIDGLEKTLPTILKMFGFGFFHRRAYIQGYRAMARVLRDIINYKLTGEVPRGGSDED